MLADRPVTGYKTAHAYSSILAHHLAMVRRPAAHRRERRGGPASDHGADLADRAARPGPLLRLRRGPAGPAGFCPVLAGPAGHARRPAQPAVHPARHGLRAGRALALDPGHAALQPHAAALAGRHALGRLLSRACARAPLPPVRRRPEEDRYTAGDVKGRLWLCGLAGLCFFATWISRYWPFAALPSGMDLGQAASVILADALHNYFMAFAPAGPWPCSFCCARGGTRPPPVSARMNLSGPRAGAPSGPRSAISPSAWTAGAWPWATCCAARCRTGLCPRSTP